MPLPHLTEFNPNLTRCKSFLILLKQAQKDYSCCYFRTKIICLVTFIRSYFYNAQKSYFTNS